MPVEKNQSKKKSRFHLPLHVYLIYLLVITLIFTGVTFSKYIASSSAGDSARVAVFGDLELTEPDAPAQYLIIPGVDITKNPQVSFGLNQRSETEAYIFVSVEAGDWQYTEGVYRITRDSDAETLLSWTVAEGWTFLQIDGARQIFYRSVQANERLKGASVIAGNCITVSDRLYASEYATLNAATKSITFQAYAVQQSGFHSPQAAWTAISHA